MNGIFTSKKGVIILWTNKSYWFVFWNAFIQKMLYLKSVFTSFLVLIFTDYCILLKAVTQVLLILQNVILFSGSEFVAGNFSNHGNQWLRNVSYFAVLTAHNQVTFVISCLFCAKNRVAQIHSIFDLWSIFVLSIKIFLFGLLLHFKNSCTCGAWTLEKTSPWIALWPGI